MKFYIAVCLTLLLGCAPKKKDTRPPLDTSDNLKATGQAVEKTGDKVEP